MVSVKKVFRAGQTAGAIGPMIGNVRVSRFGVRLFLQGNHVGCHATKSTNRDTVDRQGKRGGRGQTLGLIERPFPAIRREAIVGGFMPHPIPADTLANCDATRLRLQKNSLYQPKPLICTDRSTACGNAREILDLDRFLAVVFSQAVGLPPPVPRSNFLSRSWVSVRQRITPPLSS